VVNRLKIIVVSVFVLAAFIACDEKKGSRKSFSICHGQEANGKEMDGRIIPSLRYGEAAKKNEQELYEQIKYGKLPMPAFKDQLTEEDIRRMVTFIRRDLQGQEDSQTQ
jgi:mono/diheme cytochrome c family protein